MSEPMRTARSHALALAMMVAIIVMPTAFAQQVGADLGGGRVQGSDRFIVKYRDGAATVPSLSPQWRR